MPTSRFSFKARLRDLSFRDGQQILRRDFDFLAGDGDLVRRRHMRVKYVLAIGHQPGVRHPCAVVSRPHLAQFVVPHFFQGALVRFRIALDRNLRSHPAHRVNAAAVAGPDQEIDVRLQEVALHRDLRPIRQHEVRTMPELLDEAENVIPSSAVQTRRMVAQLVEDLVHLE